MKVLKNDDGYYAVSAFIAIVLTIVIHYYFISNILLHPTIHATVSILIFFLLSAAISPLLEKVWSKF